MQTWIVVVAMSSTSRQLNRESQHEPERPPEDAARAVLDRYEGTGAWLDVGLRESRYTSPLPAPDDLDRYVAQIPEVADQLMAAGEREQAHRHRIENFFAVIEQEAMQKFYAGQWHAQLIGLILGLGYLGVVALAIVRGYPLIGTGAAAFGIAAVVWALRRDPSGPNSQPVAGHDAAARSASLGS